ncbi:MAG: hypothetical protein KF851_04915 [Pirellulaceae bacterium]|nr:hypothetical protein [Pirellulaceae bacterium]
MFQQMFRQILTSVFILFTVSTAWCQSTYTENTLRLDEGAKPANAELDDFGWLVGRWIGQGLGGDCEEVFLPPWRDTMFGTFRYVRDDKLVFSEFFSFVKSDGGLVLKLRHFHPDMTGWEERLDTVNFPLIRVQKNAAYFGGLTYRRDGDELKVWVAMRRGEEIGEADFTFKLAPLIGQEK